MYKGQDRRTEERINYGWFIWFTQEPDESPCHGMIQDLSSKAVSFSCDSLEGLGEGHELTTYFYVPNTELPDFLRKVTRVGKIGRVDSLDNSQLRIQLNFYESLPFKPSELEAVHMALDCSKEPEHSN